MLIMRIDINMRSVLLIGLGDIGVGYDLEMPVHKYILSHARAFSEHPKFELIAGVDTCSNHRERFTNKYGAPSFSKAEDVFLALSPDLVVVATPTDSHLKIVRDVLKFGRPKAILCEKPLAYSLTEAQQIYDLCNHNNCALYVNYFRQAEPGVNEIQKRLKTNMIKGPIKGIVWYSKGLFNSGSHFIDLLCKLMGDARQIRIIEPGRLWKGIDPEPDVEIGFERGRVLLIAADAQNFFHNSVELIASNGILRFADGGTCISWQQKDEDLHINGNIKLSSYVETIPTDFERAQFNVVEELSTAMDGHTAQISTGFQAIRTQEILESIKERL